MISPTGITASRLINSDPMIIMNKKPYIISSHWMTMIFRRALSGRVAILSTTLIRSYTWSTTIYMIANAFATSTSMRRVLLCVFNSVFIHYPLPIPLKLSRSISNTLVAFNRFFTLPYSDHQFSCISRQEPRRRCYARPRRSHPELSPWAFAEKHLMPAKWQGLNSAFLSL